jgi:hypothetical protein
LGTVAGNQRYVASGQLGLERRGRGQHVAARVDQRADRQAAPLSAGGVPGENLADKDRAVGDPPNALTQPTIDQLEITERIPGFAEQPNLAPSRDLSERVERSIQGLNRRLAIVAE